MYGVLLGTQSVGKVTVTRQGLYYHFSCRCRLTGEIIYRLRILCGDSQESLGVLVPVGGGFGLDTKLAVKRLVEGEPSFLLVPKHEKSTLLFVPVYPEEPFSYIARLKDAFLARKNGEMGIMIK